MYKYKITVFTPTYNRAHTLKNAYESLKNQTFSKSDFEWLIVDDGSDDETESLVKEFVGEEKDRLDGESLNIRYVYKKNGGKHTAINKGVVESDGELFFILDSDDALAPNSLTVVEDEWKKIKDKEKFFGIVGLCTYPNGEVIGTTLPEDTDAGALGVGFNFVDLYFKLGVRGDKTIAFTTEVLKKFPFPERDGIRFLPESVVWHEMSKYYSVKTVNEPMIVREYLDDGLTKNIMSENSIKGIAFEYFLLIDQNTYPFAKYPKRWLLNYMNLSRYSLLSGSKYFGELKGIKNKLMYVLMYPLGYVKYAKQKKEVH
ncbi:MAG: glycosyltransferase family 2 protein [Clostridioides sp.]|jgi:glycosyltransferase involved in cell wall biosynthesis|nr:glycosyltransferase family 2 protein [Clostridioides sp.]